MKAAEFFQAFEGAFSSQPMPSGIKRMSGARPKWMVSIEFGSVEISVATCSKGAGLLEHGLWPGEFRTTASWVRGKGKTRSKSYVSLFQYTTGPEVERFASIQRAALQKYLDANGPDPYGTLRETLTSDLATPKPNVDTYYYYFDAVDASGYGEWHGELLRTWLERFWEAPESNEDWSWRVLWPHLKRPTQTGAGA